jgi:hypothetical protein
MASWRNEFGLFLAIKEKSSRLIAMSGDQSEEIAVDKYEKPPGAAIGQQFLAHLYIFDEDSTLRDQTFVNCQRTATLLVYSSDIPGGGETFFRRDGQVDDNETANPFHVLVSPKKGRVLARFNCHQYIEVTQILFLGSSIILICRSTPLDDSDVNIQYTEKLNNSTLHDDLPIEEGVNSPPRCSTETALQSQRHYLRHIEANSAHGSVLWRSTDTSSIVRLSTATLRVGCASHFACIAYSFRVRFGAVY